MKRSLVSPYISIQFFVFFCLFSAITVFAGENNGIISESNPEQLNQYFRITTHPESDIQPSWSHNRLVFASNHEGHYNLWLKSFTRNTVQPLRVCTSAEYDPAWSADGKHLAWVSCLEDGHGDIWAGDFDPKHEVLKNARKLTAYLGMDAEPC
jgi:Tol biopolymer transport system component